MKQFVINMPKPNNQSRVFIVIELRAQNCTVKVTQYRKSLTESSHSVSREAADAANIDGRTTER